MFQTELLNFLITKESLAPSIIITARLNKMEKENKVIAEFDKMIKALINKGYRFSVIHNPNERLLKIVSSTNPDRIKHDFPEFNIYLLGLDKIVEKVFFYGG